jgi:hypothetical protein
MGDVEDKHGWGRLVKCLVCVGALRVSMKVAHWQSIVISVNECHLLACETMKDLLICSSHFLPAPFNNGSITAGW